jgi:hypothetical protein
MGCTSGENVRTAVAVAVAVAVAAADADAVADFYCDYCSLNLLKTYYSHLKQRI